MPVIATAVVAIVALIIPAISNAAQPTVNLGSTLTTASSSVVQLINGALPCHVFWQVGSSATFGTSSDFTGHVLALTSITATKGATFKGQLLARNGAVTLDTNTITKDLCAAAVTPSASATP